MQAGLASSAAARPGLRFASTAAGILAGKACCAYPAVGPEVTLSGGTPIAASESFDNVHVDGNLVTAPAWPAHPAWIRAFLEVLGTPVN